jgi:hypothetical protein
MFRLQVRRLWRAAGSAGCKDSELSKQELDLIQFTSRVYSKAERRFGDGVAPLIHVVMTVRA